MEARKEREAPPAQALPIFRPLHVGVGVARGGGGGPPRGACPGDRGQAGQTAGISSPANTCQDSSSTISPGTR